ncbi:MAG: glycosyl transferase family 4, partial [Coleofasciculus sp. A1-SPW-01]
MLTVLAAASVLASILLTNIIKRRFSNHLLDIPNDRSSHTQPTPRGGGLGFILAF